MKGLEMFLQTFDEAPPYASNIISYWNFDTDYTDQVGTNDGTPQSVSLTSGLINNSLTVSGANNRGVAVFSSTNLSFGNGVSDQPFSMSFWVKFNAIKDVWFLNKRGSLASQQEYQFFYLSGKLRVLLYSNSDFNNRLDCEISWSPSLSTWYHLAVTYDGISINVPKIYIDGVQVSTTDISVGTYVAMNNTSADFYIARAGFTGIFSLNGQMDETAVFDAELSASQISDIYNKGLNGLPLI